MVAQGLATCGGGAPFVIRSRFPNGRTDCELYARLYRPIWAGNAIAHRLTQWSRKAWRRAVEARLSSSGRGFQTAEPIANFTPVFIVRSGRVTQLRIG